MATPDVLNPPSMYRLRPLFDIKKGTGSALSYLEQRQEWVLGQITNLQDRVKSLAQQFGIGPDQVGILQQVNSDVSYQDVVVSCPTSSPPYLLAALYWYLSTTSLPCSCSIHVHSSATSTVTEDLKRFFDGLPSSNKSKFKLTLIWKSESVCPSATMVVSPHNQTPVEGLANIARYICRQYCPALYEDQGPMAASQMDNWLEAIIGTLFRGSSKEKASVIRKLNSHVGSSSFLGGDRVSIADIISYSVLASLDGVKPTSNVKKWLKRVENSFPCLKIIPFTSFKLE
ncbi:aminoacyl tRNA synthase complex-interacting multifunctional protein 2-like isoform X2 [Halichondria panicea]|uniref:aminoacyl tRNA synthase complex-interacting multifunctional protein 2-like isoform X2 n=1 Tax=Halichondria panicea TaxID=6063 RepID=UPI00312B383E